MSRSKLGIIWGIIMIALCAIGSKYLSTLGNVVWILYVFFIALCGAISTCYFKNDLRRCIIPVFVFLYWALHNSLALFRLGYLGTYNNHLVEKEFLVVIVATVILSFGCNIGLKIKTKPLKLSKYLAVSDKTYYTFVCIYFIYFAARMYFAGGILNFIYADYQYKLPESLQTIFFIIKNILTGFDYFNLLYVVKKGTITSKISKAFFVFSIFNVFIGGGSTGILYLSLCLVILLMLKSKNKKQVEKYLRLGIPVAVVGIYIGILIRFNRTNYANFSFTVLNGAMDSILGSATFDCQENLLRVMRDFSPTYSIGQLIYPFVNWIPRALFPVKPTELGTIMASTYHNFATNANAGFATTPMGDFYYDFGFIGIFLGMLLEGVFIGCLQRKLFLSRADSDITLWVLIYTVYTCSNIPNWYTGFGIRMFYMFVFYGMIGVMTGIFGGGENKL